MSLIGHGAEMAAWTVARCPPMSWKVRLASVLETQTLSFALAPDGTIVLELSCYIPGKVDSDSAMPCTCSVRGSLLENGTVAYFGNVPYAQPPIGEDRWKQPRPLTQAESKGNQSKPATPLDCTISRPGCRQVRPPQDTNKEWAEDCLFLDIWAAWPPWPVARRSVLVWLVGTGLVHGSADDACGLAYAKEHGLVFVSVQYRLGAFGWLSHKNGDANCGLWDIVQALRWIQQEINAFGGDPSAITVGGHGCGADAVVWLCASPIASGLFDRAIIMSPGTFAVTATQASELADEFVANMRMFERSASLTALQNVSAKKILEIQQSKCFTLDPTVVPGWRTFGDPRAVCPPQGPASVTAAGKLLRVPSRSWPAPTAVVDGTLLPMQPLDVLACQPSGKGLGRISAVVIGSARAEAGREFGKTADEAWDAARLSVHSRKELVERLMWELAGAPKFAASAADGWDNSGLRAVCEDLARTYEAEYLHVSEDTLWQKISSDLGGSCMVQLLATRLSRLLVGRVWRYQFEGFGGQRAFHGLDKELLFNPQNSCSFCDTAFASHEELHSTEIQRSWIAAWAAFTVHGDPNASRAFDCNWPAYSPTKPWELGYSVLQVDGLFGASVSNFDRVNNFALHRCSELIENVFMLNEHDAADRGVTISRRMKSMSRPCHKLEEFTFCRECQTASTSTGFIRGAWLCSMCWSRRRSFHSYGKVPRSAQCTECGVGPAIGGEVAMASLCRICSQELRPRDLRWREASSVYWVQPEVPEGLLECCLCGIFTDLGFWGDIWQQCKTDQNGINQQIWKCAACCNRWYMGSTPGLRSRAQISPIPIGNELSSMSLQLSANCHLDCKVYSTASSSNGKIVSLGSWCGVKAALRGLALGGPTMPFDWIRISHSGLVHALQSDFADFLDYDLLSDSGTTYITKGHRFFHDVLDDPRDHEKYQRRFRRFRDLRNPGINDCNRPLVFVRASDTTVELTEAASLYDLLADVFDSSVYLLIILDCQYADHMIFFEAYPRLMVNTIGPTHVNPREYDIDRQPFVTAYHEPILSALWHAQCGWQPQNSVKLHSVTTLLEDTSGLLRHVSLGEDLQRYNYGIPQMPPDDVLREVMGPCDTAKREFVNEAVQARVEWEASTGNSSENSAIADEFLLWMDMQLD